MSELLKNIKGNTYYIKGRVNTGVYVYKDNRCVVIDTGSSNDWGRKIHKALEAADLEPELIINTHSHADHYGGNDLLIKRTSAEVAASGIEAAIILNPYLEPFYLYSAHPPKELHNRFLMGKECRVDRIIEPGDFSIGAANLEIVDLKGHSPGQIGVATPDDVLMAADSYFASEIIEKYKLPYFTNIGDTLDTLKRLKNADYSFYLPCHGELSEDIKDEIDINEKAIHETIGVIRWALIRPMTREELLVHLCEEYGLELNITQYYLNQSTLSAYLSYMTDGGMLRSYVKGGRMLWEAV